MRTNVSYHLIEGVWNRVELPNVTDKDGMIRAQIKLRGKEPERIVLLEGDGTGWTARPVLDKADRQIPSDEMLMIRLSAVEWI